MKFLVELAVAIVAVFAILVISVLATDLFKSSELRDFCSSIKAGEEVQNVLDQAKLLQFPTFPATAERSVVTFLNHRQPMFRYACTVSIRQGRVERALILSAD